MSLEQLTLRVNGKDWVGFTSASFELSETDPVPTFTLASTQLPEAFNNAAIGQNLLEVFAGRQLLVTGYATEVAVNAAPSTGRVITVRGAGKLVDLVRASVEGSFTDTTGDVVIREILKPFGLTMVDQGVNWNRIVAYTIATGQSALGAIYETLQLQQATCTATPSGELFIRGAKSSRSPTAASNGYANFKSYSVKWKPAAAYSSISYVAQDPLGPDGESQPSLFNLAQSTDENVQRFRPLLRGLGPYADAGGLREATEKAVLRQSGEDHELNVSVTGWRRKNGDLLTPGTVVAVQLPDEGIDGRYTIQTATLTQDPEQGTNAQLRMVPFAATQNEAPARRGVVTKDQEGQQPTGVFAPLVNAVTRRSETNNPDNYGR